MQHDGSVQFAREVYHDVLLHDTIVCRPVPTVDLETISAGAALLDGIGMDWLFGSLLAGAITCTIQC